MKFASRSAMLSLSSAKAGSRLARGNSVLALPEGVVWEARRLVREGGRRGVVGREGRRVREVLRGLLEGVVEVAIFGGVVVVLVAMFGRRVWLQGCPAFSVRTAEAPR